MDKLKKNSIIAAGVILLIAVLIAIGFFVSGSLHDEKEPENTNGVVGIVSDGWSTGLDDQPTESASIQIPGYSMAEMKEEDTSLHLSIGNPEDNSCGFYATLMLEDGTVLYESELLVPGYGLTEIPLSETLQKGEYTAVVLFQCVTLDDAHAPLNSAESEFTLVVK